MAPAPAQQPQKRIGIFTAGIIVALALLVDGLQFLLTWSVVFIPLSFLLTFFAAVGFFVWFAILGVNYFDKNAGLKVVASLGSVVAELIPVINAVPATTLGVVVIVTQTMLEDKGVSLKVSPRTLRKAAIGAATGGAAGAARAALRQQGRREQQEAPVRTSSVRPTPRPANDNIPPAANDSLPAADSRRSA
ncbi:MAG TPA: hypothetical protein PK609_00770 [Candidatus Paceibacterota bacterium]|nr:hypothetical protein [Candidatus Paceibacterota bacterium]